MITKIKDRLQNNEVELREILEEIGCHGIKHVQNRFQFGTDEYGRHTGNVVNIDTLSYKSFSHNTSGDIITLVSEMLSMNLGKTIKWLANRLNIKLDYTKTEVSLPFGGFFKNISKVKDQDDIPPITYPLSTLDDYGCSVSKLFLDDNIDCKTQELFNIGYCHFNDRITIPWFNTDGSLCGVIGRENKYHVESNFKYLALLPINKSKLLFGLNFNYKSILNYGTCYVFESEKSTMQMHTYGLDYATSLGCKTVSDTQAKILKSLYCNIVLCFDEGVTEEEIKKECEKVKIENPFFTNKVGYIYDKEGLYLKHGSKCSPSDLGREVFEQLVEEFLMWI